MFCTHYLWIYIRNELDKCIDPNGHRRVGGKMVLSSLPTLGVVLHDNSENLTNERYIAMRTDQDLFRASGDDARANRKAIFGMRRESTRLNHYFCQLALPRAHRHSTPHSFIIDSEAPFESTDTLNALISNLLKPPSLLGDALSNQGDSFLPLSPRATVHSSIPQPTTYLPRTSHDSIDLQYGGIRRRLRV